MNENSFTLAGVEVRPAEGLLIVDGDERHVEPKVMDVLLALAGAGDQFISREALTEQVWPRGFVTDDALNRCISNLRKALGDDHRSPRFIVTVPRRGYRLAVPVETPKTQSAPESTIVLPFQNLSAAGDEYLADGLTELLIARLSVALARPVISRTTAMAFKNTQRDVRSIREQLGVHWVVEGSVLQIGKQVQVVVQLIDATSDSHAWSDTWTRDAGDALTLLNEISRDVAARIRTELEPGPSRSSTVRALPTDVLRQYLHGLHLVSQRTHTALQHAVTCFEQVLAKAPDHAPALTGLSLAWVLLAHYGAVPAAEGFGNARTFAEAALDRSPDSQADALACLAAVGLFHDWQFDEAEQTVWHALDINPNHEIGLLVAADICLVKHQKEKAQHHMDLALSLDPLNTGLLMNAGDHLILQQRYGEAANVLAAALEISPDFRPASLRMALACAYGQRRDAALHYLQTAREIKDADASWYEYRAIVHGRLGNLETARQAAGELTAMTPAAPPWKLARAWASAGEPETAMEHLQAALETRSSSMPFVAITPVFENLRKKPEFLEIVRKTGLNKEDVGK